MYALVGRKRSSSFSRSPRSPRTLDSVRDVTGVYPYVQAILRASGLDRYRVSAPAMMGVIRAANFMWRKRVPLSGAAIAGVAHSVANSYLNQASLSDPGLSGASEGLGHNPNPDPSPMYNGTGFNAVSLAGGKRRKRSKKRLTLGTLSKRLTKLSKNVKVPWTMLRNLDSGRITCDLNQVGYFQSPLGAKDSVESLFALAPFKYVSTSLGTTHTMNWNAIMESGSAQLGDIELFIKNWRRVYNMRNNYNTPIKVEVFTFKRRPNAQVTENVTPLGLYYDGLWQAGTVASSVAAQTDPRWTLFNSPEFVANFRILSSKKYYMKTGDELIVTVGPRFVTWNPKADGPTAGAYQVSSLEGVIIRVQGVVAHDRTDVGLVGTAEAALDYVMYETAELGGRMNGSQVDTAYTLGALDAIAPDNAEIGNPAAAQEVVADNDA